MYLESSTNAHGHAARLLSPAVTLTSGQSKCFTFWYNMYGPNIGSLNVYFKRSNNLGSAIWIMKGNQGPLWKKAVVTVTGNSPLQV